jgi:hypothetical protein
MSIPVPPAVPAAKRDEFFRESYQYHAVRTALEYFNVGRYAVHGRLLIAANLLHHAVELLLKANHARGDGLEKIRKYGRRDVYGHSLAAAWQEFKRRIGDPTLDPFDRMVAELDKWEDIRYPEKLLESGVIASIALVDQPAALVDGVVGAIPVYTLAMPEIDRLVKLLVEHSGINPEGFHLMFEDKHAGPYFTETNGSPLR